MRSVFITAAALIAALSLGPVPGALAQEPPAAATATLPMVAGEVTKVDASAGKITIKHDAIPNLSMDGMTMVFKAGDAAMTKAVKAGDKIKFTADKINGQLTAMKIEKVK